MQTEWSVPAWCAAMDTARELVSDPVAARRRWAGQTAWDADHMCTESTRYPRHLDARLRRCCKEAGISRYYLISYMLRAWMAAWEVMKNET